ncbi:MAG: Na+/H+ antiporter subunit B [Phycisphaeraceae bacterium]|nr:Na+/H+ antiporter subunit B [Phycisphaeraceae bacterium]MCW5753222.1 Na+/H+ antiporter subunit B [Phycisphaeraceae bacterium]
MNSTILQTATRYLLPLLLVVSLVIMLQGHNKPGGGFIGALIGAAGFALHGMAFGPKATRTALRVDLVWLMAAGLAMAIASGLFAVVEGSAFLTGQWGSVHVPGFGSIKVGTPLLFDIGVYCVVLGVVMSIVLALLEE